MSTGDVWTVVAYEVRMLSATSEIVLDAKKLAALPKVIANALEESSVLHTRILCEVFLSRGKEADDITLCALFPELNKDAKYGKLHRLVEQLRRKYGSALVQATPCWTFNKMMAHPTTRRGSSYDYTALLRDVEPAIWRVIREVEALRGVDFTWCW